MPPPDPRRTESPGIHLPDLLTAPPEADPGAGGHEFKDPQRPGDAPSRQNQPRHGGTLDAHLAPATAWFPTNKVSHMLPHLAPAPDPQDALVARVTKIASELEKEAGPLDWIRNILGGGGDPHGYNPAPESPWRLFMGKGSFHPGAGPVRLAPRRSPAVEANPPPEPLTSVVHPFAQMSAIQQRRDTVPEHIPALHPALDPGLPRRTHIERQTQLNPQLGAELGVKGHTQPGVVDQVRRELAKTVSMPAMSPQVTKTVMGIPAMAAHSPQLGAIDAVRHPFAGDTHSSSLGPYQHAPVPALRAIMPQAFHR